MGTWDDPPHHFTADGKEVEETWIEVALSTYSSVHHRGTCQQSVSTRNRSCHSPTSPPHVFRLPTATTISHVHSLTSPCTRAGVCLFVVLGASGWWSNNSINNENPVFVQKSPERNRFPALGSFACQVVPSLTVFSPAAGYKPPLPLSSQVCCSEACTFGTRGDPSCDNCLNIYPKTYEARRLTVGIAYPSTPGRQCVSYCV